MRKSRLQLKQIDALRRGMLCKKVLPTFVRAGCNCNKIIWRRCCRCLLLLLLLLLQFVLFLIWLCPAGTTHTHTCAPMRVCECSRLHLYLCLFYFIIFSLLRSTSWLTTFKYRQSQSHAHVHAERKNKQTSKKSTGRQGICRREIPHMDREESHYSWSMAHNSVDYGWDSKETWGSNSRCAKLQWSFIDMEICQ